MVSNGSEVDPNNVITPTFDELPEEHRQEIERRKLEYEKTMLACFQKTRQGIIMKETALPSVSTNPEVKNTVSKISPSHEDIAHMINQTVGVAMDNVLTSRIRAVMLQI